MGLPARDQRVAIILRKADLFLPEKIPTLAKIPPLDFESSLVEYSKAARSLLAEQRKADPATADPRPRSVISLEQSHGRSFYVMKRSGLSPSMRLLGPLTISYHTNRSLSPALHRHCSLIHP